MDRVLDIIRAARVVSSFALGIWQGHRPSMHHYTAINRGHVPQRPWKWHCEMGLTFSEFFKCKCKAGDDIQKVRLGLTATSIKLLHTLIMWVRASWHYPLTAISQSSWCLQGENQFKLLYEIEDNNKPLQASKLNCSGWAHSVRRAA